MKMVLILGGARSGKSRYAQELAAGLSDKVLFVATAEAKDEDMRFRIAAHRKSRPASWDTIEAPLDVSWSINQYAGEAQVVIIDCITMLVSNILLRDNGEKVAEELVAEEIEALVTCIKKLTPIFILVSNEVGLGLVPDNQLGRVYRDCLGKVNQTLAGSADEVYFMAAGIPVRLK
jgi:adenosylcobinamide kinase/adenosylcobinamide-phosphate guanylyltransferase